MRSMLGLIACTLLLAGCSEPRTPKPIPTGVADVPRFLGAPATAQPLPVQPAPVHPFMAQQGFNSMHGDSASSDTHPGPGPLGHNTQVTSRVGARMPGGQCATVTFARSGRLVALCTAINGFRIQLLEPRSLELLAEYKLPVRPSTYEALIAWDKRKIMEDSSGAYFYLDHQDRVVMADSQQVIQRIAHRQVASGAWEFYQDGAWDLSGAVPHQCVGPATPFPSGECDPITAVMPDYQGLIWWVTRHGRLGTINPDKGTIRSFQLQGEEIQNGFSVAEDGVYIVSDHAMYRFESAADGSPRIGWREPYDRGISKKVGSINQGSGTTPTLLGRDYVTIADNAEPRINIVVYRRQQHIEGPREVCRIPVFDAGHSATDNSMIGLGNSILLENNAGYSHAFGQKDWNSAGGGITRVDIHPDGRGCDVVWSSEEKSPSVVAKLSTTNGLAYFYTYQPQASGENAWYLTAVDFHTGKTRFKILTGVGRNYDNNWAPITLGPDGTAYIGTTKGIVAVWDAPAAANK